MKLTRDADGFIEVGPIIEKKGKTIKDGVIEFTKKDKKYYYKKTKLITNIYHELIADELLNYYGLKHVSYDLASNYGFVGTISKDYDNEHNFIYMESILSSVYGKDQNDYRNNLDDIIYALSYMFTDAEAKTSARLRDEVISLFLFDIAIGNPDRHNRNYGVKKINGEYHIFVFDNQNMLESTAIYYGQYGITLTRDEYEGETLERFIELYHPMYIDRLKEYLSVITEENLESIFRTIEYKIKAPVKKEIKAEVIKKFMDNKNNILNKLNKDKVKKLVKVD